MAAVTICSDFGADLLLFAQIEVAVSENDNMSIIKASKITIWISKAANNKRYLFLEYLGLFLLANVKSLKMSNNKIEIQIVATTITIFFALYVYSKIHKAHQ